MNCQHAKGLCLLTPLPNSTGIVNEIGERAIETATTTADENDR